MRQIAVSTMLTNLVSMVGVDSFLTAESTAAVRSFNRFGKFDDFSSQMRIKLSRSHELGAKAHFLKFVLHVG